MYWLKTSQWVINHHRSRGANIYFCCFFQNFAYQKMEWPKHYTSEKVLVLMTYTELMNRICQKEASSQINPLRYVS